MPERRRQSGSEASGAQLSLDGSAGAATRGEYLCCRLTPSARIDVQRGGSEDGPPVSPRAAKQMIEAFARGRGQGVLHLAVAELSTPLPPPLAYWRDLGRLLVGHVCGALDPTDPKTLVIPEPVSDELEQLALAVPPMVGAELLDVALLAALWFDLGAALSAQADLHGDGVQGYLKQHGSAWNVVGRVCYHLAENKRSPQYPFAFLATYVHRISRQAKPQHLPLGRALKDYAGAKNRQKLLALLAPLSRAAEIGLDALLDFDVSLTLGGHRLNESELAELLAASHGLVLLKGQWVEVDREKLSALLDQWRDLRARASAKGISFGEAMRLLAGAGFDGESALGEEARPEWSEVVAGNWLSERLQALRSPELRSDIEANAGLHAELRPYQKVGAEWLATLCGLGMLVFTQFREMTEPLAIYPTELFGQRGHVIHGGTAVKKRQALVKSFQEDDHVPFMVRSLKAAGTGLNLTAASHVVHFDRWWNPAVEDQATDRAYRIGQKQNVLVHKFVCSGTIEERIDELIATKQALSSEILSEGAEGALTEMSNEELVSMVSLDLRSALEG